MTGYRYKYPLLLVTLLTLSCVTSLEIHGVELAAKLKDISENGLGRSRIQDIFNKKATFTANAPTGDLGRVIVTKLAASVGRSFKNYSNAVKKLHHSLIEGAGNLTRDKRLNITQCCKLKPQDDLDRWCYRHQSGSTGPVSFDKNILDVMKENKNAIPNIGWQYYGNEEGLFIKYPATADDSCKDYDPRLRPWYAEASAPAPKDIVIGVQSTEQLAEIHIMRNALDILFDTINPNDRITVVKYGKDVNSYLGTSDHSTCFSHDLALATPQNRRLFREFIDSEDSNTRGPVKLLPVLTKAFDYFKRAADRTDRRKLLVIFIASDPVDVQDPPELIREIAEHNAGLQRKVVIQTYAFGSAISNNTKEILQKVAQSTSFETSSQRVQAGTFNHIQRRDQLRLQLHSYYSVFADPAIITEPIATVPYFDFSGLGLVMSVCLPLHLGGKLRGVTCVDFEIEDIFFDVMYYHQGIDAYAFIIDRRGRTILHPLLPKPTERWEDPKFIHIMSLEKDKRVQEIIESMKSGGNGSRRYPDAKMKPRLGLIPDIPDSQYLVSEYHWTKVPNTDYSLCMVFTNRDREVEMELKLDEWKDKKTNYIHPYTLIHSDNKMKCSHDGQTATTDGSVVMFSGAAYKFLSTGISPNNSTQRQSYDNFFKGSAYNQAPEFKKGTRRWVALTGLVDSIWTNEPSTEYDLHIVWRHLVTTSGVIRIYPGTNFTEYDPSSFLWYKEAILRGNRLRVNPVVKQNGFNVMLSQAIMQSSPIEVPIGVVGGEIRPTILYNILQDVYPACRTARCFIVDGSGHILTHKLYSDGEVEPSHIVTMEPAIARYLIDNGHMVGVECLDFLSEYRTLFNWKIALKEWYVSSMSPRFELHSVSGTDIYVGITWDNQAMSCDCENITKCRENNQDECKCPCFTSLKFNLCNNTLPEKAKNGPSACSILRNNFDVMQQHPKKNVNAMLEPCFCHDRKTESFCSMKNGCQWCMSDGKKHPSCHNVSFCGPGIGPTRARSVVIVAVPVILLLLLTIIIIAVCFIFRHSLCVHAKLCVKKSLCGDPIYEQADDTVESTPQFKGTPVHDDSGIATDDVNDKTSIFVISVQGPESSESKPDAAPPLPNRNPHKKFLPLPDNHEESPVSNQSRVFPESQTEKDTVAETPGTPDFNQLLEDSAENTYVNESADITFDPHAFDSLSLQLSLFSENGRLRNAGNSHEEGNGVDNLGYSASDLGSVGHDSAGVSSRDSGVLSAVSRQGSSQTYLKTP